MGDYEILLLTICFTMIVGAALISQSQSLADSSQTRNEANQIQWSNFTNDLKQFSVEYPTQWQAKFGNRFTGDPPLTVVNGKPTLVATSIQIKIENSNGQSVKNWAELEKKNFVDFVQDTKLIEPVTCDKYTIDGVQACSFEYAGKDGFKTTGNLVLIVNDNANTTHLIKYKNDATMFDLEEPIVLHMLSSYKLLKNHSVAY